MHSLVKFHLCSSYSSRDISLEHYATNRKSTVKCSHCLWHSTTQSPLLLSFFDVPMAAATSRDGKTVAAVDWCGFGCVGFALDSWCPQNSLILSNKHYWWMLRHGGGGSVGRAAGGWTPRLCCKSNRCLSSDGCFLANTTLGSSDVNLTQNKHNSLNFPYTKHLMLQKVYVMTVHYFKLETYGQLIFKSDDIYIVSPAAR